MRFLYWAAFVASVFIIWFFLKLPGHATDLSGTYKDSPLHSWFDTLKSGKGMCCSFADGLTLTDVDWDIRDDGHYTVKLDDGWHLVPDEAVITEPNKYGQAVVWPYKDANGQWQIRCFIAGAGT